MSEESHDITDGPVYHRSKPSTPKTLVRMLEELLVELKAIRIAAERGFSNGDDCAGCGGRVE